MTHTPQPSRHHSRNPSIPAHIPLSEPTELDLSPSKARAHATTTQAWTQIINWLSRLFPSSPVPPFERNAATLAYFQSLMYANLAADSGRKLVHAAQTEQLDLYREYANATDGDAGKALQDELALNLSVEGDDALKSLAESCITLDYLPHEPSASLPVGLVQSELGKRMLNLSASIFEVEQLLTSLSELRASFEAQMAAITGEAGEASDDDDASIATLRQNTSQLSAQTKHLALKLSEYHNQIAALSIRGDHIGASIDSVKQRERELAVQKDVLRKLEDRLKEYHGLPPDVEASRAEVKRAQTELEMWKRKREELFEEMGGV